MSSTCVPFNATSNKTKEIKFICTFLFKIQVIPRIPPTVYFFQPCLCPPHILTTVR